MMLPTLDNVKSRFINVFAAISKSSMGAHFFRPYSDGLTMEQKVISVLDSGMIMS